MQEFSNNKSLKRARQYATGESKKIIDNIIDDVTECLDERIRNAQRADVENVALINNNYKAFLNIADSKVAKLKDDALERKDFDYNAIIAMMGSANTIAEYERAIVLLDGMNGYKDSLWCIEACKRKIENIKNTIEEQTKKETKIKVIIILTIVIGILMFGFFYSHI